MLDWGRVCPPAQMICLVYKTGSDDLHKFTDELRWFA